MAGTSKFAPEQKEAVVAMVLDHGLSVQEAVAKAAQGINGVEPFEMSMSTAYDVLARERRRHETEALDRFVGHAYELLDRELTEIERQQRRGEGLDCVRLGRLARAATHVAGLTDLRFGQPSARTA